MDGSIDARIAAAAADAERIELEARQIEARILKAGGVPPRRPYGRPVSGADVARNLTLRSQIDRNDPPLAAFLGIASGAHLREQEAAAQREAAAARMAAQTAALRDRNAASRRHREQAFRAGSSPLTGRRMV